MNKNIRAKKKHEKELKRKKNKMIKRTGFDGSEEMFKTLLDMDINDTFKITAAWNTDFPIATFKEIPVEIWEIWAEEFQIAYASDRGPGPESTCFFLAAGFCIEHTHEYLYGEMDDSEHEMMMKELIPRWMLLAQWYISLRGENEVTKLDDVIVFDTKFLANMNIHDIENEMSDIYEQTSDDELEIGSIF
jgi:hypothetical protein